MIDGCAVVTTVVSSEVMNPASTIGTNTRRPLTWRSRTDGWSPDAPTETLDAQKETLAPETRAVLDANLKTIDDALAQVRAALVKDPGNSQLAHLLTSTHQKKVDALKRVVRLNRT